MAKKNEIKEQIAHLLMRSNVGLVENVIIQQVTATSNVKAITDALNNMKNVSEVTLEGKRWKITSIGRSLYSDLNSENEPDDEPINDHPSAELAHPVNGQFADIEIVQTYQTPDGRLHETQDAARRHMLRQQLLPRIDQFIETIGVSPKQKGLITSYVTAWEEFKLDDKEQAA